MNRDAIAAVVRKDLELVIRNRGVRIPLLAAPVVILVVLPVLLVGGGEILLSGGAVPVDAAPVLERLSPEAQEAATGVGGAGRWAVFMLVIFLAPLYLLVPLIVATVIAADSFAGERERGTLEALLHTPVSDDELLIAKLLSSWLPAVAVGIGGFAVYTVVANAVAWPVMGRIFFPTPMWLALAFWVGPAVAALGLGLMVVVSSRVQSLQAAHQIGSLVVLPVVLLVIAQVSGFLLFGLSMTLLMGTLLWLVAALLLRIGTRTFDRDQLASRL